jgi:hypothetical protein
LAAAILFTPKILFGSTLSERESQAALVAELRQEVLLHKRQIPLGWINASKNSSDCGDLQAINHVRVNRRIF